MFPMTAISINAAAPAARGLLPAVDNNRANNNNANRWRARA